VDVPGPGEVGRSRRRVDGGQHRRRAIVRRNARRRSSNGVDRRAEGGFEPRRIVAHEQRNLELVEPLRGHRQTDQPPAETRHEIDRLRRHLLGGDRQVALVLAVLIVDDDDHRAAAHGVNRVVD
jgi:hypothetical protein